ncbi:MAG: hypothetical protein EBQ57_09150 [Actinobacteria bacterium]|nr:hypothetical protein [Actinomycetota bacterium]
MLRHATKSITRIRQVLKYIFQDYDIKGSESVQQFKPTLMKRESKASSEFQELLIKVNAHNVITSVHKRKKCSTCPRTNLENP